jgi:Uma2 family endonuclease
MATTTRTRMTVEEFHAISEDERRHMELIDGEIVVTEPRFAHARLQATLIGALEVWRRRVPGRVTIGGPTEVRLTPHDAYGPDLIVCGPRPQLNERGWLDELPLVCVEIRSPTTWRYDVGRKKSVYEAKGVPELWLVDGFTSVLLVFRRSSPSVDYFDTGIGARRHGHALSSPLLPGFELALSELFEP